MRIAFIGLDHVGQAMALSLHSAGHEVTVCDAVGGNAETLARAGVTVANSIASACRSAKAVFTLLASDAAVETTVLGPGGVVDSLPWNAIHIGSSTISVECADRLVEAHSDAGQRYIAAPVIGGSNADIGAGLHMIAAGRCQTVAEVQVLFDAIGEVTVLLNGWPSKANLVQRDAKMICKATLDAKKAKSAPSDGQFCVHDYIESLAASLLGAHMTRDGLLLPDCSSAADLAAEHGSEPLFVGRT